MAQWGPFFVVTLVLLVLLLALARQSQQFIHEHGIDPGEASSGGDSSADDIDSPVDDGASSDSRDSETVQSTAEEDPQSAASKQASVPADEGHDAAGESKASSGGTAAQASGLEAVDRGPETPDTNGVGRTGAVEDSVGDGSSPAGGESTSGEDEREPARGDPPAASTDQDRNRIVLTPALLLANVAFTQALVVVVLLGAAWYFSIPAAAFGVVAGPIQAGWQGVALGVAFGLVLWVCNELATTMADAVGASYDERVRELLAPESPAGWIALFAVVLPLIAFAEELLFRAALIGVPAAGFGLSPWLLAVGSSAAFALGHGAQGRVGIVVTGVLGFALAAGFILTESLLVVVVAHYVINAMEFFVHEYLGVANPVWSVLTS